MTAPILMLAVDQRPWLTKALYNHTGPATPAERAVLTDAKHLVLDGLILALPNTTDPARPAAAILVDNHLGPGVAERARANGITVAMPVELGGQDVYETEPEDLSAFLNHYAPDYTKVLVRYNVEGDPHQNALQLARLADASTATHKAGSQFLFELLVPATASQLDEAGGDSSVYDREMRPKLILRGMEEIARDVDVDIWKLEHLAARGHYRAAADLAKNHQARCILLGAGASPERVHEWLRLAASSGFSGFAIGRSIWWDAVRGYIAGETSRQSAAESIAERYRGFVDTYLAAEGN